jgi:hypothetical protein
MEELQTLNIAKQTIEDLVRQYNLNRNVNTIGELLEAIENNHNYGQIVNFINGLCPNMRDSLISALFNNIQTRYNELYMPIAQEPLTDEDVNGLLQRVNQD